MWKIAKEFEFDYGHRVWSQTLNCDFSLDNKCVCRHQHGHRGMIRVYLSSKELKDGMVTDFKHLNFVKKFIDDVLDHKMILDTNDPAFNHFYPLLAFDKNCGEQFDKLFEYHKEGYYTPWMDNIIKEDIHIQDVYNGLVLVEFVPTSENLSKWLFDIISDKLSSLNIRVDRIQFYETPKSQSNYYNPNSYE